MTNNAVYLYLNCMRNILICTQEQLTIGWTQGMLAVNTKGEPCNPNCRNAAVAWSLRGAVEVAEVLIKNKNYDQYSFDEFYAVESRTYSAALAVINILADILGRKSGRAATQLDSWNDDSARVKSDVISLVDEAIKMIAACGGEA